MRLIVVFSGYLLKLGLIAEFGGWERDVLQSLNRFLHQGLPDAHSCCMQTHSYKPTQGAEKLYYAYD